MLALEFFTWWYGQGWLRRWQDIASYVRKTSQTFSVNILARTLFAPWRRIISYPGEGLNNHLRAMVDNLFSRLIGFCVRVLVIIIAVIALIFVLIVGITSAVIWPFMPLVPLFLLIKGVF